MNLFKELRGLCGNYGIYVAVTGSTVQAKENAWAI